ncbi:hypothetical protein QF001_000446 [Paraburkholderia youngii]
MPPKSKWHGFSAKFRTCHSFGAGRHLTYGFHTAHLHTERAAIELQLLAYGGGDTRQTLSEFILRRPCKPDAHVQL